MTSDKSLVRLVNATKTFRLGEVEVHALRGVSLDITHGEFLVILGPSGSGKTTLLNLIGGLDSATSGQVLVDGRELGGMSDRELTRYRRDTVGFIFQFFNLMPTLTATENIEFALDLRRREMQPQGRRLLSWPPIPGAGSRAFSAARAGELLEQVGLSAQAKHFPSHLSGGEQQRVAIARALAKSPPLLLADEPTGNLDYRSGIRILELLRKVTVAQGQACILVTHNSVIGEMADRVVRLRDGEIERITMHESPKAPSEIRW